MPGFPQQIPREWSITGLGQSKFDGVNAYYTAQSWRVSGEVAERTLLQIQMQYYHPSQATKVIVRLNDQLVDTLTFPPAIYRSQSFAAFVDSGTVAITVTPASSARLYFPAVALGQVPAGRSEEAFGAVRWNLNGDLGTEIRSALQVDGSQISAFLDDRPWTVPLYGGRPLTLNYKSVAFGAPYQVEWTAFGPEGKRWTFKVPSDTVTLPRHVAEESQRLPTWTVGLQARAVCKDGGSDCYPIQLSTAYVLGVSSSQPSGREIILASIIALVLICILSTVLLRRRP